MDEIKALLTGIYKKLAEIDDKMHKVNSNVMEVTMGLSVMQKNISNIQYDLSELTDKGSEE